MPRGIILGPLDCYTQIFCRHSCFIKSGNLKIYHFPNDPLYHLASKRSIYCDELCTGVYMDTVMNHVDFPVDSDRLDQFLLFIQMVDMDQCVKMLDP